MTLHSEGRSRAALAALSTSLDIYDPIILLFSSIASIVFFYLMTFACFYRLDVKLSHLRT